MLFANHRLLPLLLLAALCAGVQAIVHAADCPPPATPYTCPADSLCINWTASTVREKNAAGVSEPLPLSEIKAVELSVNGALLGSVAPPKQVFIYPVPPGTTYPVGSVLSVVTVDTAGTKSTVPFTCSLAWAYSVPKLAPAAPTGVTVFAGP
jgi:hypothetical protein